MTNDADFNRMKKTLEILAGWADSSLKEATDIPAVVQSVARNALAGIQIAKLSPTPDDKKALMDALIETIKTHYRPGLGAILLVGDEEGIMSLHNCATEQHMLQVVAGWYNEKVNQLRLLSESHEGQLPS